MDLARLAEGITRLAAFLKCASLFQSICAFFWTHEAGTRGHIMRRYLNYGFQTTRDVEELWSHASPIKIPGQDLQFHGVQASAGRRRGKVDNPYKAD